MLKEEERNIRMVSSFGAAETVNDTRIPDLGIIDDSIDLSFDVDIEEDYENCVDLLWNANPDIYHILRSAPDIDTARNALFSFLEQVERDLLFEDHDLHALEMATIRECLRVLKNVIGPINESRTGVSAMQGLWRLAHEDPRELEDIISKAFLFEFIYLFRGISGKSNIYSESSPHETIPAFLNLKGRKAAMARTEILDALSAQLNDYMSRYPSGLEQDVIERHRVNRNRILRYFKGSESDWRDYTWHLDHIIHDLGTLEDLIEITPEQAEAVEKASEYHVPFGITPYYLSLMDPDISLGFDHAVRAQVIPPLDYVNQMVAHRMDRGTVFDFMGENDTSPVDLVTRRYPGIAILKPFNTCAQICVYCQRNWEIDDVMTPGALASRERIDTALEWFDYHKGIGEVLVTGGDPCVMEDQDLRYILSSLSEKEHITRIRIGTRTPVVLPMRWTDRLVNILAEFHEPGKREIAVVVHFEHSYEITPDVLIAIRKIREKGISVYNQEVFTFENSRRFESVKLRRDLKLIGVDPYYTFNMKGKGELRSFMVPIARLLQERKEEARLMPGLDRTDEPVFNVPRLGKNHLRAWQDHEVIMIKPDGTRVYEFHPWEKNIDPVPPYYYTDVPLYGYLKNLADKGEDIRAYRTIWYYF